MRALFALTAVALPSAFGCSNFLVSKGATEDDSTHVAYNSDGQSFYGYMTSLPRVKPAADGAAPRERKIYEFGTGVYMGSIPEAERTYNVIGNMNEKQVSIGETTFDGLSSLASQPGAIIDYYSLMWLALQRSATAREAIMTMDALTKEHGYASTGESFSIADPNEVWHMDFIGKGPGETGAVWVAVRLPEGTVGGHANQARIRTWDWKDTSGALFSPDVVSFAVRKGLYPASARAEDFSFADVFDPITVIGARLCEARVWDLFRHVAGPSFGAQFLDHAQGANLTNRMPLFVKVQQKLSLNDTMWQMRSHYEGSWFDDREELGAGPYHSPYRARPVTFESGGKQYAFNRNIGYVGTFFHFINHARGGNPAGGVTWFGVDDASLSVRVPMYGVTSKAPQTYAYGNGDTSTFKWRAAFWAFNTVANFAYARHSVVGAEVQRRIVETESRLLDAVAATDRQAAGIVRTKGQAAAEAFLSNFSTSTADAVVDEWVALFPELMTLFRDGLVVDLPAPKPAQPEDQPPPPECTSPGYDAEWYQRVVAATGDSDRYLLPTQGNASAHALHKLALLGRS